MTTGLDDLLFRPSTINSTTVENRFFVPAMQRATRDYKPTPSMAKTPQRRAESG